MPTIGIIAEGATDQLILERLLLSLCDTDEKPFVNLLQPPSVYEPGNWDKVFKYIASERFRGAFAFNDFVVVHIDTDVCDRFIPPIARTTADGDVPLETLINQVKQRLIATIDRDADGYYEQRKSQILFAVAVHSIECWLLPLFFDRDNQRQRRDNCLHLLNQKLSSLGFSIDEGSKGKGYVRLMREDKIRKIKRDKALEISQYNPGFADFTAQVASMIDKPTTA